MRALHRLRLRIGALAALAWLALAAAGPAQERPAETPEAPPPAVLIADRVSLSAARELIAEGNVTAYQGQTRLTARRISYDSATGLLDIEGPIRLTDGTDVTVLADAAALDRDLRNGLLAGARMVLDQQLQMAALQMSRTDGRYTQLYKTVVTSCRVCADGRAPLWQIRARRVIHDQQEKQLYFDDAQFRIGQVPVFWLPRLRLPDPTLKRATGFLIPSVRSTSRLGTGIKVPYFFRLGDHADLTLSPYLSSRTSTLDFRYRQAFRRGGIELTGAYTRDDLLADQPRGYLFGTGGFQLRNGFRLSFDIEWASDNAYLLDYGYEDQDRLATEVALTRVSRDKFTRAALIHYDSLRDGEIESRLPTVVGDVIRERRYFPRLIGGELRLGMAAHAHYRSSDLDGVGRDVLRATGEMAWLRSWTTAAGLRADWQVGVGIDIFEIGQDSAFADEVARLAPMTALTLRAPLTRVTRSGATEYLEPLLQIGWSDVTGDPVPTDESGRVEFDQGNLLSLSRFPADDAREHGPALAYGVNWSRYSPGGWHHALTVGQVLRRDPVAGFSISSGLSGSSSDILLAGQIQSDFGLDFSARSLFNDALDVSKAELRGTWSGDSASIGGTFVWLGADPAEGRASTVSELFLDGSYDLNRFWTASASWRYDVADTRPAAAGIGLAYRNECVEVDLSLNRRYTSSTSVEPSTDFGFTIALRGFGATNGTERYVRSCSSS
ncbi:MAG: LPS assembly protein LptD [Rhodobacteraceae bacterium]|nr:LPS assembly protein LptD [Paracoccaceae bacterium]